MVKEFLPGKCYKHYDNKDVYFYVVDSWKTKRGWECKIIAASIRNNKPLTGVDYIKIINSRLGAWEEYKKPE